MVPSMTASPVADDRLLSDAVLPVQFEEIWHRSHAVSPERSLALAVLWQAFDDLSKHRFATRRRQQRFYIETYRWVASESRDWPFSFVNLCDTLNLDPEAVRDRLLDLGYGDAVQENAA
jgi:hypothetical protein